MNKFLLLVVAVIFAATTSFAQISGGPKAGLNFSNIKGDNASNNKYKIGFNLGGFVNYSFSGALSVQAELAFSTKGAKINNSTTTTLGTFTETFAEAGTWNLNYLDIPILFQAKLPSGVYFQVGPQLSLLLGFKSNITTTSTTPVGTNTTSSSSTDKSGLNSTDFGIAIGAGYQMSSGLFFGLRSCVGVSNIYASSSSTSSTGTSSNPTNHNMLFQLSLGYAFGNSGSGHGRGYHGGGHHRR